MAAYEYRYTMHSYQTAESSAAADAAIAATAGDGWRVHTAMPNYVELCLFWEREVPAVAEDRLIPEG